MIELSGVKVKLEIGSEWAANVVKIFPEMMSHIVIVSSAEPLISKLPLELNWIVVM